MARQLALDDNVLRSCGLGRVFKVQFGGSEACVLWCFELVILDMPQLFIAWQMWHAPNLDTHVLSALMQESPARVNSLDFCRTDDLLVTASDDDWIRVYNIAEGKQQGSVCSRKYGVQNICFTHSPDLVVYASRPGRPVS